MFKVRNPNKEWPKELLELFDDPLLADVKPKPAPVTAGDRVQRNIDEIRSWIDANGREPSIESGCISEKLLAQSLRKLRDEKLWM